jgi:hypothetical protein
MDQECLSAYWNTRRALLKSSLWAQDQDVHIQTLLAFITKIEQWYPLLAKARDEAHYAQLSQSVSFDPANWLKPGPALSKIEVLRSTTREINNPRFVLSKEAVEEASGLLWQITSSYRLFFPPVRFTGYYNLQEPLLSRLKDVLEEKDYPIQAFGCGALIQGWPVCIWAFSLDNPSSKAWVTPNEGPWDRVFGEKERGVWVPITELGLWPSIKGDWEEGTPTHPSWFATPSKQELHNLHEHWKNVCGSHFNPKWVTRKKPEDE